MLTNAQNGPILILRAQSMVQWSNALGPRFDRLRKNLILSMAYGWSSWSRSKAQNKVFFLHAYMVQLVQFIEPFTPPYRGGKNISHCYHYIFMYMLYNTFFLDRRFGPLDQWVLDLRPFRLRVRTVPLGLDPSTRP